jgi:transcription termination/antitermination protein NusA
VMTREELDEQLDRSVAAFSVVPHVSEELAEVLVSQGFFSFDDLSVIEPDQLAELGGLTAEQCDEIVAYADVESEREEREAEVKKEQARQARLAEAAAAAEAAASEAKPAEAAPAAGEAALADAEAPAGTDAAGEEAEVESAEEGSDEAAAGDNHDLELAREVADDVELAAREVVSPDAEAVGEDETVQASLAESSEVSDARDDLASIGLNDHTGDEQNGAGASESQASGDDRNPAATGQ